MALDPKQMAAEIERLTKENTRLTQAHTSALAFKVSEKGALSVYGLGRFPVTLYLGQWERLLGSLDPLKAFIQANHSKFTTK